MFDQRTCNTTKVLVPVVSGVLASDYGGAGPFDPVVTLLVAELHSEYVLIHIHVFSVVNVRRTTHTASGRSL